MTVRSRFAPSHASHATPDPRTVGPGGARRSIGALALAALGILGAIGCGDAEQGVGPGSPTPIPALPPAPAVPAGAPSTGAFPGEMNAPAPAMPEAAPSTALAFPSDRYLGEILVRPIGSDRIEDWRKIGVAHGSIPIPAGMEVTLLVSRDGMADLSPLRTLPPDSIRELRFDDRKSFDRSQLAHVAALTGLVGLDLNSMAMDDEALAALAPLTELRKLGIGDSNVTDAGLAHLAGMTKLERLWLFQSRVTDAGMATLGRMTSLRRLILYQCDVSSQGLEALAPLTGLERLGLTGTRVDDRAAEILARFPALEEISLGQTAMTSVAVERLRALKPNARIDENPLR